MKVVLLELFKKQYKEEASGEFKPYYEIWVSDKEYETEQGKGKVFKVKAFANADFEEVFKKALPLLGRPVVLTLREKHVLGNLVSQVVDISKA